MKKIIILIAVTFLFTGCMNLANKSYEEIINYALNNDNINLKSYSENGYNYYLPEGLRIKEKHNYNVVFQNEKNLYYMYIDVISYFNKRKEIYSKNETATTSIGIEKNEKFGYLEINLQKNKKYLVEIMYNYAKIEVIVDECDLKETVGLAMSILSSISYNDTILENMIGRDTLNYSEIEFNIFDTVKSDGDLIIYDEDSEFAEEKENKPDTDLVN